MKLGLFSILTIVYLVKPLFLEAQQYSFQHFSVNEGLIQSDVNNIIQDNKKYIWVATNGGVSRFDGLKIKNYTIPISHEVYYLVEGEHHEIFALLKNGVGMIRNDSVYSYRFEDEDMKINKCRNLVFRNGKLWMFTNHGITFFDGKKFHVAESLKSYALNACWFSIDNNDVIWIEDVDRNIWYTENDKLVEFKIKGSALRNGSEIAVNQKGNVFRILGRNLFFLDSFEQGQINDLQRNGDYWYFTTKSQVIRKKGTFTELLFETPEKDKVATFFLDKEKRLWIGTQNGFYYSNSLAFKKYSIPNMLDNRVSGIVEDNDKNLWFSSFSNGLTKYKNKKFEKIDAYKNVLNTYTFSIGSMKKSNGNLLFTTTKGILQFDGKRYSKVPHLPDQGYMFIYEDKETGAMFYAGENSLVIEAGDSLKVFDNLKFNLPQIFHIFKDKNNIYRMGGAEMTIFFDGHRILPPDSSKYGYTKGMYSSISDSRGNIWIATRYGIMFYDYKSCKPILANEISEAVFDLKIYFGKIYFGTIKGVGTIDTDRFYKDEKAVSYFDYKNGYPGEEVVQNGAIVTSDSAIWIPATRGVIKFSPSRIQTINCLPQVQLESLIASNPKGVRKHLSSYELNKKSIVNLTYKLKDIEINYHCISISDPEGITYKYKLDNYDYDWREVPFNVRSIKYSQLPAGDYAFKISAFNKEGIATATPTIIFIQIGHPFWLEWWFQLLSLLVAVFIAFLIFRNMKEKEHKKAEIQQQILKLKADALAAQMNPHFVFNCISSINALINLGDKQEATLYLGRFATLLRSVLKSVRANEISLDEELLMIENYMHLEQARYNKPFNYTIKRPNGISSTLIMIPPLIIQPYVENSILHGFAGTINYVKRINILAVKSGDQLKVVIKDNGSGITQNKERETGLGTKITNERIALLEDHAQVLIESYSDEINHGTTVTISIPLKIKNTENDECSNN